MCNHTYMGNYKDTPFMGRTCPYPKFYEMAQATATTAELSCTLALPVDDRGACIFHSKDIAWKRENEFTTRFLELVQLLNADNMVKHYDFVEFVFVGQKLGSKERAEHATLRIFDVIFKKQAFFNGAIFLDSFEIEDVDFSDGANFCGAMFSKDVKIASARFNGLIFNRANVKQLAFFTKVAFESYAYFDEAVFSGEVKFEDSRFLRDTDFSSVVFAPSDEESPVRFLNVRFEGNAFLKALYFDAKLCSVMCVLHP